MRRTFALAAGALVLAIWTAVPAGASTGWTQQATPNPAAATSTSLNAVSCTSASACTAVGRYFTSAPGTAGLVERWNGSKWSIESNPPENGDLSGVACASAKACIAVGGTDAGGIIGLIGESWNGTKWTARPVPAPSGMTSGSLNAVQCSSASSCFAVGTFNLATGPERVLIEHWNGSKWSIRPVPARPGELSGVACQSARSCFAVGAAATTQLVLAEHWNGTAWTVQRTPALPDLEGQPPGNAALSGVSCAGADCMAAGSVTGQFSTPESTPVDTLSELWNGKKWVLEKSPNPGGSANGNEFEAVSCTSATSCTATGGSTTDNDFPDLVMVATWNGTKWTSNTSVADPSHGNASQLDGVACTTVCTAVGGYTSSSGVNLPLAERN